MIKGKQFDSTRFEMNKDFTRKNKQSTSRFLCFPWTAISI